MTSRRPASSGYGQPWPGSGHLPSHIRTAKTGAAAATSPAETGSHHVRTSNGQPGAKESLLWSNTCI